MNAELCRVKTNDGLLLDGVYHSAKESAADSQWPVDAFLLVHGTGSNFYAPGVLETFANQAVLAGVDVLRSNTRGHDQMASIPSDRGSVRGGAAWESIAESVHDLDAWITLLASRGKSNIALVGHSLGGVKCLLYAARVNRPEVRSVIGIAPPRFHHTHWMTHPATESFRESFESGTQLIADGRGESLLSVKQPLPMVISASGFVEKYGPADKYDYVPWLSGLSIDVLLIYGTRSLAESPAFDSLPAVLDKVASTSSRIHCEYVEGANTPFHGFESTLFELASAWLSGDSSRVGHK